MEALQIYWWLIISLLGGLLVFLLFVQGGQTLLVSAQGDVKRSLIANALGRKWELTFTTLVVFGGAYFASFPLYYSTSFGGAYWLWMALLLSFILQAVSYEFRSKEGNLFGQYTYDWFLCFNGFIGCLLLGVAVSMQFFGADFTVERQSILDGASPVISCWNSYHGLAEIFSLRGLVLGFAIFFLARTLGVLFLGWSVCPDNAEEYRQKLRVKLAVNGCIFVLLFLVFLFALFMAPGYSRQGTVVVQVPYKYFFNFIDLWWIGATFLLGVLAVLYGIARPLLPGGNQGYRGAFWWAGLGTVAAVTCLLCISGYNDTSFLPSVSSPQSSLFIDNASSSEFTLRVMAWVTVLLPIVIGYIAYVWHKMTTKPLTPEELSTGNHY